MKNKKRFQRKHVLLVIVALLLATTLFVLEKNGVINLYTRGQDIATSSSQPLGNINYGPPTENEKSAGNEQKSKVVEQNSEQKTDKPSTAKVVIVDASQYENTVEVRAFISNLLEDGTCTFTFRNGNNVFKKSQPAIPDASTTPCTALTVSREEFVQAGKWNLTVTYESKTVEGSNTQEVLIK